MPDWRRLAQDLVEAVVYDFRPHQSRGARSARAVQAIEVALSDDDAGTMAGGGELSDRESAAEWSATGLENQGEVTPRGSIPPLSAEAGAGGTVSSRVGRAGGTVTRPVANRRPGDPGAGSIPAPSADDKSWLTNALDNGPAIEAAYAAGWKECEEHHGYTAGARVEPPRATDITLSPDERDAAIRTRSAVVDSKGCGALVGIPPHVCIRDPYDHTHDVAAGSAASESTEST